MGKATGMPEPPISYIIQRHSLRKAGIEPAGGLVDDAQMPLGWVGVADQKLYSGVAFQGPEDNAQDSGLAITGRFISEPEPSEGETVIRLGILD
jgi:hypothetical protein